ncbi:MAG TPA: SAM-dependent methyltransferase [Roseiarcus sp.]|nr:SAM-dependent methyltransferase [Roseiarcus sp.]
MQEQASLTARGAAAHRAAHQLLEGGVIFRDPFAVPILGESPETIRREAEAEPRRRIMRLFVAARSRIAEDRLAEAVTRGLRQVVALGAGLDTFALRNPFRDLGLKVFEVDHPATQEWKRARIAEAGLPADRSRFTPVDFERQNFFDELEKAGFDRKAPAFFLWLGVVPYLSRQAIEATLGTIAASQAEAVFDYGEPPEAFEGARREHMEARMKRVAELGEPWLSFFTPTEMAALLEGAGFARFDDLGPHEIATYLKSPSPPPLGTPGGHVVHARSRA